MSFFQMIRAGLLTTVITGCSSITPIVQDDSKVAQEVAVLTDYELKDGFIKITAVGHGCTFFDSFKVKVANKEENSLKVVRTRPDDCGMKERTVSLQYSFKHLRLDLDKDIQVKNPIN